MSPDPVTHVPVIRATGLTRQYPDGEGGLLTVLDGVDLSVAEGEAVAVVGPSGSGKSTLLALLAGLESPTTGSVQVLGQDLSGLSASDLAAFRGRHLGFVFQSFRLLPALSAEENVRVPLELGGLSDSRATARRWLERVGLATRARHPPNRLSGGEQQRVAIARAMATDPRILFADEPTGNLDHRTGSAMADLLFAVVRERRTSLVVVTHDRDLAGRADRIIELDEGRIQMPETVS